MRYNNIYDMLFDNRNMDEIVISYLDGAFCGAQWPLVRWPVATKRR